MNTKNLFLGILIFSMFLFFGCVDDDDEDAYGGPITEEEAKKWQQALDELHEAEEAIEEAEEEGRTEGLDEAKEQYEYAEQAYENEEYDSTIVFANEAEALAVAATVPEEPIDYAQEAYDALMEAHVELTNAMDEGRTEGYTEAYTKYEEALDAYNAGNYENAITVANESKELAIDATVPEGPTQEEAFNALMDANDELMNAQSEGRTEGYDEAVEKYNEAVDAYNGEDYEEALELAEEAKDLAVAATVPQPVVNNQAQDAYDALMEAYNALNAAADEGRTDGYTEAYDKYEEALDAYNAGEYVNAITLANESEDLAVAAVVYQPTYSVSKPDAMNMVIDLIESYDGKEAMEGYIYPDKLHPGDSYSVISMGETEITVNSDGWLFWIDKMPDAKFAHPVEVVFIDVNTGAMTTHQAGWWPRVNGQMMDMNVYNDWTEYNIYYRGVGGVSITIPPEVITKITTLVEFGACNSDPEKRKRAVIVYAMALDSDTAIKQDAANMYDALCEDDYFTTVLTYNESEYLESMITTEIAGIATASKQPDSSLNSFVFYTVTHGNEADGNLIINARNGSWEVIDLNDLAAILGSEAFKGNMWSESYTVIQDSCYSGNALDAYPPEASSDQGDVGWVFSSQNRTQTGYGDRLKNQTSVFTNALIDCMAPLIKADELHNCVQPNMDTALLSSIPPGLRQYTLHTELTDITDPIVPVFSQ